MNAVHPNFLIESEPTNTRRIRTTTPVARELRPVPNNILDLKRYPNKNYQGHRIEKDDRLKYLELVNCPLGGEQLKIFKYHIKNDKLIDFNEDTISELSYSDISGDAGDASYAGYSGSKLNRRSNKFELILTYFIF